jgi:hypothetical protein
MPNASLLLLLLLLLLVGVRTSCCYSIINKPRPIT